MMLTRRNLLRSMLAAPAVIVAPGLLMPVRSFLPDDLNPAALETAYLITSAQTYYQWGFIISRKLEPRHYVVSAEKVRELGLGDIALGHRRLQHFVERQNADRARAAWRDGVALNSASHPINPPLARKTWLG